ncbi:hypothetical protein BGZ73_004468 [Actinomortierella ambigua]|nr:hypothetical protein BGZ73_004468 [Actinomortierella ambigua]
MSSLAPLLLEQLGPEPVEILSIDLAGHGLSSHRGTEDHSRWRYVDEADQVAEQMGWTTHALIGHTDKRVIAMKQDAFFTSVHAAVRARTNGNKNSSWPIREEVAAVFIPRSLKPAEKKDEDTQIVQKGYTWRWDRMIMIADVMTNSDLFHKAFLRRIICPLLFVLAIDGLAYKNEKGPDAERFCPEERTFTLRNGIVIAAKHWKNSAKGVPRDRRRFLALHGFLDNAASFDL